MVVVNFPSEYWPFNFELIFTLQLMVWDVWLEDSELLPLSREDCISFGLMKISFGPQDTREGYILYLGPIGTSQVPRVSSARVTRVDSTTSSTISTYSTANFVRLWIKLHYQMDLLIKDSSFLMRERTSDIDHGRDNIVI